MKLFNIGYVFVVQLSLITSLTIKSSQEKAKHVKAHHDNAISLAQAVQKLRAMKLANEQDNKNDNKVTEKMPNEKVISETAMAAFTEIYLYDTTLRPISQHKNQNVHMKARGGAILKQPTDELSTTPSENTEDIVVEQTLESENEAEKETSKMVATRNLNSKVKHSHELRTQNDRMNHEGTLPNTDNEKVFKPEVKTKLHPHAFHQNPSLVAKENKHDNVSQIRKVSDHIMSDKSKQVINHHYMKPHNKAVTDMNVAEESVLDDTDKSKLTKEEVKVHGNSAVAPKTTSPKVNDQHNTLKSGSNHHQLSLNQKKQSPHTPPHNLINNKKITKIKINSHEITSMEDADVIEPSYEDADNSKEYLELIGDSESTNESKDDSELIEDSNNGSELTSDSKDDLELTNDSKDEPEVISSPNDGKNLEDPNHENTSVADPAIEDNDSLHRSPEDDKLQIHADAPTLKVDSDTEDKEVSINVNAKNSVKSRNPDNKLTGDTNKKKLSNNTKKLQRKPSIKKPIKKYHPVKLPPKTKDAKSKNLDSVDIDVKPKVDININNEPGTADTLLQKTALESSESKVQNKMDPLMLKQELKITHSQDDHKLKENSIPSGQEETDSEHHASKDVLTYLKHESQLSNRKKSISSKYIIAVTSILIVSTILFTIVGVYYRQIRIDRQKYIGHMLLETEDDEDMQLFNRQTYHDESNLGYESWNAIR